MISKEEVLRILDGYDKEKIALATLCSHSSLQIFLGAKQEGFETIGLCSRSRIGMYDAFPRAKPSHFIVTDGRDIHEIIKELRERNAVLIPHGSLVAYFKDAIEELEIPIFGNRKVLLWEGDRQKMFRWMEEAGLGVPRTYSPENILGPSIVKFPGAMGGMGYVVVADKEDYERKIEKLLKEGRITERDVEGALIQEYLVGNRFYPHYFYSPLHQDGYEVAGGRLELLSIDKRVESNVDEIYRPMSAGLSPEPSFTVVGNLPVILRESLVPKALEMGKKVVEAAERLFGGIPGPFCIEAIIDERMNFKAFEISARIVAGTNLYPMGSQYSVYLFDEPMSTGRRIAREIKAAVDMGLMERIIY